MEQYAFIQATIQSYRQTLLWQAPAASGATGEPLDRSYTVDDVADWAGADQDVHDFVVGNWQDLFDLTPDVAGHNFALNRNGHGAGFWDDARVPDRDRGQRLSEASKVYGHQDIDLGDDGRLYLI